jgi:hypothetical protein
MSYADDLIKCFFANDKIKMQHLIIVGSLSGSRLKSVRFLVGESGALVASGALAKIIKINH